VEQAPSVKAAVAARATAEIAARRVRRRPHGGAVRWGERGSGTVRFTAWGASTKSLGRGAAKLARRGGGGVPSPHPVGGVVARSFGVTGGAGRGAAGQAR